MIRGMRNSRDEPEAVRRVRLFRNGRSQAVRIPRDFELDGAEVVMWRDGDRLVIEPVGKGRLLDLLARLPPLPDAFPDVDDTLEPLDPADEPGSASASGTEEEPEIRNRKAPDARAVRRNRTVLGSGRGSVIGGTAGRDFKALLAACPLEGVDLVRPRDIARDVDVVVFPPRRRTSDAGRT